MKVLGIKCSGHDTGAACLTDINGFISISAVSEARLNRRKHSYTYPLLSIDYVLRQSGITALQELDLICIDRHGFDWPEQLSQFGRYSAMNQIKGSNDFNARFNYLIEQTINFPKEKVVYIPHIDAHAASAYYVSGMDNAAVLTIEGGMGLYKGEGRELHTMYRTGYGEDEYQNGKVVCSTENSRPLNRNNISNLYDLITRKLGLDKFAAGKTMALAAYRDQFPAVDHLKIPKDRHKGFFADYTELIRRLEFEVSQFVPSNRKESDKELLQAYWVNIAREAQDALEEDVLYYARLASELTDKKNLCLAGGVALSCVTNRKILDLGLFDNVFVQPAASDEGIPLGCALWGYYKLLGGTKSYKLSNAYLGTPQNPKCLISLYSRWGIEPKEVAVSEVAELIASGKIIGRCFGGSEYGPRALGNRSILADPRIPNMLEIINTQVKHRERFRPFAPSSLESKQNLYFDLPVSSPFMLMACKVIEGMKNIIPAVIHVDGTSRVQTVRPDQNADYHQLIEEFGKLTGVYVLLNTSFNDDGEPIVEDYYDALLSFLRTGLDYLYIDGYLISRPTESTARQIRKELSEFIYSRVKNDYDHAILKYCNILGFNNLEEQLQRKKFQDLLGTVQTLTRRAVRLQVRDHGPNIHHIVLRKTLNQISFASRFGRKGLKMTLARAAMLTVYILRNNIFNHK